MWFPARQKRLGKVKTHPVRGMGIQNFVYTKEKSRQHGTTKISIPVPADLDWNQNDWFLNEHIEANQHNFTNGSISGFEKFLSPSNQSSCKKAGLVQRIRTVITVSQELLSGGTLHSRKVTSVGNSKTNRPEGCSLPGEKHLEPTAALPTSGYCKRHCWTFPLHKCKLMILPSK